MKRAVSFLALSLCLGIGSCSQPPVKQPSELGVGPGPALPSPDRSLLPTINIAPAQGWPEGRMPAPTAGLKVTAFARGLDHPRWIYVLPNGDVLVAETSAPPKKSTGGLRAWVMGKFMARAGSRVPSADRITLLRDTDGDGVAETRSVFLQNLKSPFGMALVGDQLYVANADALWRYPYKGGQDKIDAAGTNVVDLPSGRNHHWTKNVMPSPDGKRLYVSVGSNSNIGENGMQEEEGRAAIWEVDAASGKHRLFATGLRNPNGMDWNPDDGSLWTVVNERDELGNDLVPDYLTSVKDGAFYGWPYSYYGQHVDTRVEPQRPDLVAKAVVPDYALGSHVAPLGMVFVPRTQTGAAAAKTSSNNPAPAVRETWPEQFSRGAFIGNHGSWNRKPRSGYQVVFVPFENGKPQGKPIEVLGGFVNEEGKAMGRPVGVAIDQRGGLLVADDVGNTIWRVTGVAR
jgi:glucose/arabinose dehydrogenase